MRKEDRRNAYTEKMIRDTVFQLLETKPIEKISVTEVCKIAGINRSTFYLHYMDCMHVLEIEQDHFCDQLIEYMESNKESGSIEIIVKLHEIIRENQDLYILLIRSGNIMQSMKKFVAYCSGFLVKRIMEQTSLTEEAAGWVAQYIISGSLTISLQYAHEMTDNMFRENLIHTFVNGGLLSLMEEYPKKNSRRR